MSSQNEFKSTMLLLATVYGTELTPEKIKIYWTVLGNCNPTHLHHAALHHIDRSEWFPKPSTLKKIILGYESADRQRDEIVKSLNRIEKKPPTDEQRQMARDAIREMKNGL